MAAVVVVLLDDGELVNSIANLYIYHISNSNLDVQVEMEEYNSIDKYLESEVDVDYPIANLNRITERIYITCTATAFKHETLEDFDLLVYVGTEDPQEWSIPSEYFYAEDTQYSNLKYEFDKFYKVIQDAIMADKRVLVCSDRGVDRAPTAVCYYLLRRHYETYTGDKEQALLKVIKFMISKRPCADIDQHFISNLIEAHDKLRNPAPEEAFAYTDKTPGYQKELQKIADQNQDSFS